jgi:glutathione S-transferase
MTTMKLHYHPLSTYSQKTLIALYEKNAEFTREIIELFDPAIAATYRKFYPYGKVPVLVDGDRFIPESSIIIEYLETSYDGGTRLIPKDPEHARRARFHDRMADLYVNDCMATIFFDGQKPEAAREPARVAQAKETLDISYKHLDEHLAKRTWLVGEQFSIADCALTAPLGYLRKVHPFASYPNITTYWSRVSERPSVKRVLDEAQPFLARFESRN